jgi:4-carboxymuconolactone decarboxylase
MNRQQFQRGLKNRREVLGNAHVERSLGTATDFNRDFQEMITEYCWGGPWERAGFDRRTRSLLTLAMLAALGHEEEFKLHVRASVNTGCSREDIKELLLHAAIYCGVPAANSAFRMAREVYEEMDSAGSGGTGS